MRNMSKWLAIGALLVSGGTALMAADTPTTKPARAGKLIKPYSELTDLTDDQKAQIISIHKKALDEIRAIDDKEKADIMELLSADQKKELAEDEAKAAAAGKHHRAAGATTKPAE